MERSWGEPYFVMKSSKAYDSMSGLVDKQRHRSHMFLAIIWLSRKMNEQRSLLSDLLRILVIPPSSVKRPARTIFPRENFG